MKQPVAIQAMHSRAHESINNSTVSLTTFCRDARELRFDLLSLSQAGETECSEKAWRTEISSNRDLEECVRLPNCVQLYTVGRKHSFSRIGITQELFESFCEAYGTFSSLWDFVSPFGFKTRAGDLGQAACKTNQLCRNGSPQFNECAYSFSYASKNNRHDMMQDNLDYDPWSIRQVAVYQQYTAGTNNTTFFVIAPSELLQETLEEELRSKKESSSRPFAVHLLILSTLHENWNNYLRDMSTNLKKQSQLLMLAQVDYEHESGNSPELRINFLDRQRLSVITEKTLDLMLIFESLLETISRLKRHCLKTCRGDNCTDCECSTIYGDFESLESDVNFNLKKVNMLYKQAKETSRLATNLLEVENGITAHNNGKALTGLFAEAKDENFKMMILAERTTRDAAAVRILTIITLIYLPMTVVASFFSSQLIQVSERGQVSVVSGAWWFAAVSIPLTAVTFLLWRFWLTHSLKTRETKMRARSFPAEVKEQESHAKNSTWVGKLAGDIVNALHNRVIRARSIGGCIA